MILVTALNAVTDVSALFCSMLMAEGELVTGSPLMVVNAGLPEMCTEPTLVRFR